MCKSRALVASGLGTTNWDEGARGGFSGVGNDGKCTAEAQRHRESDTVKSKGGSLQSGVPWRWWKINTQEQGSGARGRVQEKILGHVVRH
jgi:hypothetical protein